MDPKNTKYLILSIVLLILSGLGIFFIFKINNSPLDLLSSTETIESVVTPTSIPTQKPTITVTPVATSAAKITATPTATVSAKTATATPTVKVTATPTIKITPTILPTATPSPVSISGSSIFKTSTDAFSVSYSSSRKLYQDTESTGNRYTFYLSSGNFAIHVSPSGTWSWTNPDRNFSSNLIVSGQNTYRYDISTQTIVDLQSSTKNYTIQCVHNGNATLKTECEAFIKSFTLL